MADGPTNYGMARAALAKIKRKQMTDAEATAYATIAQAYATLALVDALDGSRGGESNG